jgi:hypothetical protein
LDRWLGSFNAWMRSILFIRLGLLGIYTVFKGKDGILGKG